MREKNDDYHPSPIRHPNEDQLIVCHGQIDMCQIDPRNISSAKPVPS